ncbi:MAG: SDR family NAD(P)-dependent oxidoreductase, partial [Rhodococcus fascians]
MPRAASAGRGPTVRGPWLPGGRCRPRRSAQRCQLHSWNVLAVSLDIRQGQSWAAAIASTAEAFGAVDVLVNNVGVFARELLVLIPRPSNVFSRETSSARSWEMKAVIPDLRASARGPIVNTSSSAGLVGGAGLSVYSATKWAVRGLTRSAALELGQYGIRVNTVIPGITKTPPMRAAGFPTYSLTRQSHDRS